MGERERIEAREEGARAMLAVVVDVLRDAALGRPALRVGEEAAQAMLGGIYYAGDEDDEGGVAAAYVDPLGTCRGTAIGLEQARARLMAKALARCQAV